MPMEPKDVQVKPSLFEGLQEKGLRDREADRMWAIFKKMDSVPVTMLASVFKRYEILFSTERQNVDLEYTPEEINNIEVLTKEFKSKINLFKPLVIIDDATGAELFTLPAIFQQVTPLQGEGRSAIDICQNIGDKAFDQPWKVQGAMNNLANHLAAAHDRNKTIEHGKQFLEQSLQLHNTVLNTKFDDKGQLVRKSAEEKIDATVNTTKQKPTDDGDEDLSYLF